MIRLMIPNGFELNPSVPFQYLVDAETARDGGGTEIGTRLLVGLGLSKLFVAVDRDLFLSHAGSPNS